MNYLARRPRASQVASRARRRRRSVVVARCRGTVWLFVSADANNERLACGLIHQCRAKDIEAPMGAAVSLDDHPVRRQEIQHFDIEPSNANAVSYRNICDRLDHVHTL